MSRAGAIRTAMGGVLRHKVQAVVIGLVLLIATASATLGFALLAASHGPFQRAFDTQHGADVALTANPARATMRQLAATRTLPGVTAAAGPFGEVTVQADQDGQPWGQLTLAGRPSPEGPVDDLVLNAGHWPDGPGQVVLDGTPGPGLQTGARLTVTGVPGRPALTVVGFANSVTSTAQGWVTPAEITRLQGPGSPLGEQMLYSFASAGGYPQLRADVRQVVRALPAGAVADPVYWLVAEQQAAGNGAIMEPFVVAFALIGLAMAVLIVGNVVSGAVVAQYHRIGVLKSIGLSPAQVVVTYLSRVGLPALAGCVAGVVVGNLLAAVAFGATAVIFAFGLSSSLSRAAASATLSATVPVQVQQVGGKGPGGPSVQPPDAAQNTALAAVLRAQPGTLRDVAVYGNQVTVPGLSGTVNAWAFGGDSSWVGYGIIAGHWYDAPGQVDVNAAFLTQSGLQVGDTATVNTGTEQVPVRIAGEVFEPSSEPRLYASTQTLPGVATSENPFVAYYVGLRPGTSAASYAQAVNAALGPSSPFEATTHRDEGNFYTIASGLVSLLALMVAVAAGLGVLNTVLMTTRDRVHDLGIFKTLGMRPGQVLTMVTCWILGPAIVAAAIAAPAAVALNTATVRAMADTAHTGVPASFTQVFPPSRLAVLSLAALAIAVVGALGPASWAARARPATALRAE
jgi:hypothetical protein